MIHGMARIDYKCCFKSQPMFSDKQFKITGVTRDSTGNALGSCVVSLYYNNTAPSTSLKGSTIIGGNIEGGQQMMGTLPINEKDKLASEVLSDVNGNFTFLVGPSLTCYIVAYMAGSPDIAGTTVNTLVGE